jgi:hypothetical protein
MRDNAFALRSVDKLFVDLDFVGRRSIDAGKVVDSVLNGVFPLFEIVDSVWKKLELFGCNFFFHKTSIVVQDFFLAGPVFPWQHTIPQHQLEPVPFELFRRNAVDKTRLVKMDETIGINPMPAGSGLLIDDDDFLVGKLCQKRIQKGEWGRPCAHNQVVAFELFYDGHGEVCCGDVFLVVSGWLSGW